MCTMDKTIGSAMVLFACLMLVIFVTSTQEIAKLKAEKNAKPTRSATFTQAKFYAQGFAAGVAFAEGGKDEATEDMGNILKEGLEQVFDDMEGVSDDS
jgi:hypothetical protein